MCILTRTALAWALALALLASTGSAFAQAELGIHVGQGYYMGDLQPDSRYAPLGNGKASFGAYGRIGISDKLAVTGSITLTKIAGTDAERETSELRNLSFQSDIFEMGLSGEFLPLGSGRSVNPYLTAGVAVYRFNPQADYNGRLIDLKPLGTEGQGMEGYGPKYGLTRLAMPVGAGVRIPFGQAWVVSAEIKVRATFFDHLDDVSGAYVNYYELVQGNGSLSAALADRTNERLDLDPRDIPTGSPRGNPANFDYYATAGINIGYRLGTGMFGAGSGRGAGSRYNKCYQF